ncbi:MAG: TM2 domain-containing protein [Nanoarchaeota archaeon]|nr:TM2 domain-containing protein [Nanoarchaeota archaeon]
MKKHIKKVNWTLTLIMSIIFGTLGVDRFIMGHTGLGILKLVVTIITLGIGGFVWWVIDIVLIATKHKYKGVQWVFD